MTQTSWQRTLSESLTSLAHRNPRIFTDDVTLQRVLQQVSGSPMAWDSLNLPVLVHCDRGKGDKVFVYANETAVEVFGYASPSELLGLPSSVSAPLSARQERHQALASTAASSQGFLANYAGTRIRKDGSLFPIHQALIWNLPGTKDPQHDDREISGGQAALLLRWSSHL